MENPPLISDINLKATGAAIFGVASWHLWPQGEFDPDAFAWYAVGGMLGLSASTMAIGAALSTWQDYSTRKDADKFRKDGSGLHTAGWATEADLKKAGMFNPVDPPLGVLNNGRVIFGPHKLKIPHKKILAPSGKGKTTRGLVPSLMHLALSPTRPAICLLDLKSGEIASQTAPYLSAQGIETVVIDDRGVTYLDTTSVNPFAPFLSAFLAGNRKASMLARELASNFEPEPKDDKKGRFWREGTREQLTWGLLALARFVPEDCTPTGLWRLLSTPKMLDDALQASASEPGALGDLANRLISRRESNREHYEDFLGTARRHVEIYEEGGLLEGVGQDSTFSHDRIKQGGVVVFIVGTQEGGGVLNAATMAHLSAFIQATKQTPAAPVHFLVDEATSSPIEGLIDGFNTLRAYGGAITFVAQEETDIRETFGQAKAAVIEANCGVKQIMGVSKYEDAERLSKTMGTTSGVAESFNINPKNGQLSRTLADQGRPLMTAAEIREMPDDEQILLIDGLKPIRCKKIAQNEIGEWGKHLARNPLENGTLPYKPKIKIKYGGSGKPNKAHHIKRPGRIRRGRGTSLLRPAYFLWVPICAALIYTAAQVGTPHLRWSYTYQQFGERTHYNRCSYIGFSGTYTVRPTNGQCPLIAFSRG